MNPTALRTHQLIELGAHAIHELALRAAGTLTAYRLLLGRCLLALDRSGHHLEYGCCNAIHYATSVLGMEAEPARQYRRVARQLEDLPLLQQLAERGEISWSKLREVARVATADDEPFWIEMCRDYPTVKWSAWSAKPEPQSRVNRPNPRCASTSPPKNAAPGTRLPKRIPRSRSNVVTRRSHRPLDEDVLETIREQAARDHAAAQQRDAELIEDVECSARNFVPWTLARAVAVAPCPENDHLNVAVAQTPYWENQRLRPNAKNRLATPAQRQEILRRDGYRCQTPGCSHQLFLQVHHIVYYAGGGQTIPDNLVVLCSACHRNLHQGRLRIEGTVNTGMHFYDANGRDLRYQTQLETAHWLDFHIGWKGEQHHSYSLAVADGTLSLTP